LSLLACILPVCTARILSKGYLSQCGGKSCGKLEARLISVVAAGP
jgi:hypothetical protein